MQSGADDTLRAPRDCDAPATAHSAAARRGPPPAWLGRSDSMLHARPAQSERKGGGTQCGHSALPSVSAAGEGADGTRRARLARSRRASGSTQCCFSALPPASVALEGDCRARTAHCVLALRDRNVQAVAQSATARRCPQPVRLVRAAAERGRQAACSPRAIAMC